MKIIQKYNGSETGNDCWADLLCENCGTKKTNKWAYNDRYYWDIVIPSQKCPKCSKSSNDLVEEVSK
jgi:hypothetical protein